MKSKIKVIIDIAIVVGVVAMFYIGGNYITTLENQVYERDRLIDRLVFRDSLVKEYFNIEEDTINHITTYSLKDEKQNFQLIQGDSNVSVDVVLDNYNRLINEASDIVNKHNVLVQEYNKLIEDYHKLYKSYDNAIIRHNNVVDEKRRLEFALSLIKKYYEIDYTINKDSNNYSVSLIPSAKIDSALLLLPHYRDMLHYDEETGGWKIKIITVENK